MKWNNNHSKDDRVKEMRRWRKIENHVALPEGCGVYIFGCSNHDVKYIGKSCSDTGIHAEIKNAKNVRNKHDGAEKVKVLYTHSNDHALALESSLIEMYKPKNNLTI
jgi:excinuclease UvrABC nuclease subunit